MKLALMMALGMFAVHNPPEGPGGGGTQVPTGNPLPPPPPAVPSQDQTDWRKAAEAATQKAKAAEEELAKTRQGQLTTEQRLQKQVDDLQALHQRQEQTWAERQQQDQIRARNAELVAYRANLLQQIGPRLPAQMHGQVFGQTEQEIHSRAMAAVQGADELRASIEAEARSKMIPAGTQQPPVGIPPGGVPAGPSSPHYVPPSAGAPSGGFPRVQNAASPQVQTVPVRQLTTEEAVRRGQYGSNRNAILDALRNGQVPQQEVAPQQAYPDITYQPQYPPQGQGIPQQSLPGGVTQPNPGPMQAPVNAAWQQQQFQQLPPPPPVHQGQGQDMAAARAAIERTRQGQNPVAGLQGQGFSDAVRDVQQFQQGNQNPQATFQARFNNSPPLPPPGQGS